MIAVTLISKRLTFHINEGKIVLVEKTKRVAEKHIKKVSHAI